MKTLRKVIAVGYIFILILLGGILSTFIYEWKQTENHKKEVQKIRMLRRNVHDAYALKVDMSLHAENIMNWEDMDTVLYHSKRLAIDSLLAEFNRYYTEDGIDEIRLLLAEKEKQLLEVWEIMKRHEALNEQMTKQIPVIVRDGEIQSKRKKGLLGIFRKKQKESTTEYKLQTLNRNVISELQKQSEQLSDAVQKLASRNLELNKNLRELISRLGRNLDADLLDNEKKIEAARESTYTLVRILTGIVSLLLLLIYVVVFQTTGRISKYENERDELIRRLESSLKENETLLDARKKMMFTITHELRTPLSAIKGYAELLGNDSGGEKQKSYSENILTVSNRMASQLNMLLRFFRLDCGKEEISPVLFRTTDIVRTLEEEFQPQMNQKGLLLLVENCTDDIVFGDRNRIVQIGENLLSNALKFTRRGFVRLTSSYGSGMYRLCVEDSGTGIAPKEQKRIFKSFERLPNALTQEGFGLGLSIVDSLVRLLGGSMELESEEGKGSRFVVTIPIMLAEKEGNCILEEELLYPKRNFNVVLIDDNNMLRDIVKEIFARYNVSCDTCSRVGELMELIRNKRYDLLITDLKMPEMDGFDILKLLRTSNVNNSRTIPVIVATASGLCNESDLLASGFDGCLFKPFSAQELMSVSERCVSMDIQSDIEPDFTMLLAYGDRVSMLDKLIETTGHDMEAMKAAGNRHDMRALDEWVHNLRSSWGIIRADGPLWTLHGLLKEGCTDNDELEQAINAVLKKGKEIIMFAERKKREIANE